MKQIRKRLANERLTETQATKVMFPLSLPNKPFLACAKLTQSFAKKIFVFRRNQLWNFAHNAVQDLVPKKVNSGKQSLVMLVCTKCQFKKQEPNSKALVVGKIFEHNPKQLVAVIGKEEQLTTMPTLHIDCPRCGNNTANVWQVQT